MKLIGAGLPRTATLSQKVALEMLGLGPCYHMVDVLSDLTRARQWAAALEGDARWDEIFEGYQSTVDWPGSFFYRQLIDVYPDAKVLLAVRPGDAWARSMEQTICGVLYGDSLMHDLSSARCRVDPEWRHYIELMDVMWKRSGLLVADGSSGSSPSPAAMERYNDEVQRTVPADRLLVWSVADGWGPLCELVGVPVPEVPFPRLNDAGEFDGRIVEAALHVLNEWQERRSNEPSGAIGQEAVSSSEPR